MASVKQRTPLFMLIVTLSLALVLVGCQGSTTSSNTITASKTTSAQATQEPSDTSSSSKASSRGWNSFMVGFRTSSDQSQAGVINVDYASGKTEALTQYALHNPQYDGIAHNGQDLLYQQTQNGNVQYYTILSSRTKTGFFYQQSSTNNTGNAIWMPDSRHALVLDQNQGVTEVDVQTGQTQKVLSIPFRDPAGAYLDRIESLQFYRDGFLYFVGSGGGDCMGALCRIQLNISHPTITRLSSRQTGTTYWFGPDGRIIYYMNNGPAGAPGIYAVNSDGTNSRNMRPTNDATYNTGVPIGFAADNSLMVMRNMGGKFQVVQLGATPRQDHILLADAAPGAASLCDPSYAGSSFTICDQNIALAPYSHAIVVQGTLANGTRQLWVTDLTTEKQQLIHPLGLTNGAPVQLLGWDQLTVCANNRC